MTPLLENRRHRIENTQHEIDQSQVNLEQKNNGNIIGITRRIIPQYVVAPLQLTGTRSMAPYLKCNMRPRQYAPLQTNHTFPKVQN